MHDQETPRWFRPVIDLGGAALVLVVALASNADRNSGRVIFSGAHDANAIAQQGGNKDAANIEVVSRSARSRGG